MRKGITWIAGLLVVALAGYAPRPALAQANDAVSLVNELTAQLNARSSQGIEALFAEGATVTFALPVAGAQSEVISAREWAARWETATPSEIPPDLRYEVSGTPQVAEDNVSWTWRTTANFLREFGINHLEYTVEAVVQGGRFASLTITPTPETLAAVPYSPSTPGGVEPPGATPGMPRTGDGSGQLLIALLALLGVGMAAAGAKLRWQTT